jgi:hypothetical protein
MWRDKIASKTARACRGGAHLFSGDPEDTIPSPWLGGVILPLVFFALALKCWITQRGSLWGRGGVLQLAGTDAIVMGFVWASASIFLFMHYSVGVGSVLYPVRGIGKGIALLGFIASLGYIVVSAAATIMG